MSVREIRIAAVALARGGAIARARGGHDVEVNRHDGVSGLDQRIDERARPVAHG